MPATLVAANLGGGLALFAEQRVDQRRLAHPAGPQEGHRAARPEGAAQLVEPVRPASARHQNGDAEGDLLELPAGRFRIVDEIALGEHDHRLSTAVEGQHELAFEAPLVRRHGEGVTQEDDVDVGRHGVGDGPCSLERRPAHERRTSRQHVLDSFAVAGRHDPITDGDVGTDVADPIRAGRTVEGIEQRAPATIDACDAGGRPGRTERLPRRLEVGPPTESVGH